MKYTVEFDLEKVQEAFTESQGKMNAEQMASQFETTKNTLYNWKKGQGLDKVATILLIMKKTGLSFTDLFTLKKQK